MMTIGWRVVRPAWVKRAFDGEGARRHGGRWNSKGTPMVYTAGSLSLAAMELLVHLASERILNQYLAVGVEIDDRLVQDVDRDQLPDDWSAWPAPPALRAIGDAWASSRDSVALRVPSAVIPAEDNLLINPTHPDMPRLKIRAPHPFSFDPRLLQTV